MQYLIQWESGAFQILTGDQLKKEMEEWNQSPPRIYRLKPNYPPERIWALKLNECWMLGDIYKNWITL